MNVLYTIEYFPFPKAGGGAHILKETVERMSRKGYGVKLLATGDPSYIQDKNIEIIRLHGNRYLANLSFLQTLKASKDADIIHSFSPHTCIPSLFAGRLRNKPVIFSVFGLYWKEWIEMKGGFIGTLFKTVEEFQSRLNFDKVLFFTDYSMKQWIEMGGRPDNCIVLSEGLEQKEFMPKTKKPFVLFVGRLVKQKGIDYLIQVARKLPEVEFKIVGTGEEEKRLKQTAPSNVKFLGFVSSEELQNLYSEALIFLLPSLGEGLPVVLLEAMSAGCAIVSTLKPLEFKGFLTGIRNVEGMIKGIKYYIENQNDALKAGKENINLVSKYTWDNYIKNLENIYSELLNK